MIYIFTPRMLLFHIYYILFSGVSALAALVFPKDRNRIKA